MNTSEKLSLKDYDLCALCPRRCHARRQVNPGLCGASSELKAARAALHFWEEPPISGERGSGAIFFSGCPLACIFCQNYEISHDNFGLVITPEQLAQMMLSLQDQGAHNINLVTALHFAPHVYEALILAKEQGLTLPIVCNTSGYESVETLQKLEGLIDIWLVDMKFFSPKIAASMTQVANYPQVAQAAILEMLRQLEQAGGRNLNSDGIMQKGIIVRHLVMPGCTQDAYEVLDWLWLHAENQIDLSIMNQYTPNDFCKKLNNDLSRPIKKQEYDRVLQYAEDLGFEHIWWQEEGTVDESFIPPFDTTGVADIIKSSQESL